MECSKPIGSLLVNLQR